MPRGNVYNPKTGATSIQIGPGTARPRRAKAGGGGQRTDFGLPPEAIKELIGMPIGAVYDPEYQRRVMEGRIAKLKEKYGVSTKPPQTAQLKGPSSVQTPEQRQALLAGAPPKAQVVGGAGGQYQQMRQQMLARLGPTGARRMRQAPRTAQPQPMKGRAPMASRVQGLLQTGKVGRARRMGRTD